MKILYKYLPSQYLNDFLSGRSIKIGTLHEYRNIDQHGDQIGDAEEGMRKKFDHITYAHSDKPETITPFIDKEFPWFRNATNSEMMGNVFVTQEDTADRYMFCCSNNFDVSAMRKMGKDCCVKIHDADEFFRLIGGKLRGKGLITGWPSQGKCIYGERTIDGEHAERIPPCAHKPEILKYQDEYRIVWEPTHYPIDKVFLRCIAIRELVSLHHYGQT